MSDLSDYMLHRVYTTYTTPVLIRRDATPDEWTRAVRAAGEAARRNPGERPRVVGVRSYGRPDGYDDDSLVYTDGTIDRDVTLAEAEAQCVRPVDQVTA